MKLEGCDRLSTFLDINMILEVMRDEITTDIRLVTNLSNSIMVADQYTTDP